MPTDLPAQPENWGELAEQVQEAIQTHAPTQEQQSHASNAIADGVTVVGELADSALEEGLGEVLEGVGSTLVEGVATVASAVDVGALAADVVEGAASAALAAIFSIFD